MEKKDLRAFVRAKKRAMTPVQVEAASARLAQQLFRHPAYQAARSLYGYLSYNQEVRTAAILRQAQQDGKRVAVPKVFGDEMKFLWLDDLSVEEIDEFNIRLKMKQLLANSISYMLFERCGIEQIGRAHV